MEKELRPEDIQKEIIEQLNKNPAHVGYLKIASEISEMQEYVSREIRKSIGGVGFEEYDLKQR